MTKTERNKHIDELNNVLILHGFTANRFGIFHNSTWKIDTRDNNLKIWHNDFKTVSKPLVQVTTKALDQYLTKRGI